jgi:hypothetical protein
MFVTLWKDKDESTGVTLSYAGDATVLESSVLLIKAHYFKTNSEAKEFIIKQAYALLSLGYEVHSE